MQKNRALVVSHNIPQGTFPCGKRNAQEIFLDMYVSFIGLRLTKTSLTLNRVRTKGQSAGYPQAQIGITSNYLIRHGLPRQDPILVLEDGNRV